MSRCERKGHKFEARYDEKPSGIESGGCSVEGPFVDKLLDILVLRIYVHDICISCGKVIKREENG